MTKEVICGYNLISKNPEKILIRNKYSVFVVFIVFILYLFINKYKCIYYLCNKKRHFIFYVEQNASPKRGKNIK